MASKKPKIRVKKWKIEPTIYQVVSDYTSEYRLRYDNAWLYDLQESYSSVFNDYKNWLYDHLVWK